MEGAKDLSRSATRCFAQHDRAGSFFTPQCDWWLGLRVPGHSQVQLLALYADVRVFVLVAAQSPSGQVWMLAMAGEVGFWTFAGLFPVVVLRFLVPTCYYLFFAYCITL